MSETTIKPVKPIDGIWPSTIQIGPHKWRITPISTPEIHVFPDGWEHPLEDYIFVDHQKHQVGLVGDFNPPTLAMVLACLIMGDNPGKGGAS